jgi:hypothetical protein
MTQLAQGSGQIVSQGSGQITKPGNNAEKPPSTTMDNLGFAALVAVAAALVVLLAKRLRNR